MLQHVTPYYIVNFVIPLVSEAHCGYPNYPSLHKYVITIVGALKLATQISPLLNW